MQDGTLFLWVRNFEHNCMKVARSLWLVEHNHKLAVVVILDKHGIISRAADDDAVYSLRHEQRAASGDTGCQQGTRIQMWKHCHKLD